MPLYTTVKHYMLEYHVNGIYDSPYEYGKLKSNEEIAHMIEESINSICDNDINGAYCEREPFNRLNRHLNYIALLSELKAY